jgi:hypothetical protein
VESSRNLFDINIYHSTLAASAPNILFSEILKFSKLNFFKEIFFGEGKECILRNILIVGMKISELINYSTKMCRNCTK